MKYSKKGWEKRKKDREGYKEFFEKCVEKIKTEKLCCSECGAKLQGHVSEVAHVLPKSYFKSVATNDLNWLPMCGQWGIETQCHYKFDNLPIEKYKKLIVYSEVIRIFAELEPLIEEKINYKTYDKYTN